MIKIKMHECVMLLFAEAKLAHVKQYVQCVLYVKKVLESLKLQVELPMIGGAKELMENWSIGVSIWHFDTWCFYL